MLAEALGQTLIALALRAQLAQCAGHRECGASELAVAADTLLIYDVGVELANSRQWPSWQDGSEFKAIRAKSDAACR
ncbi:hypothetical protein XpopCFBP1817_11630 [Xanthomonas populi]|uniref:Uncharacterized protein n=1 Tax=Xanthomonas populi TaxID=53414 RepID=A0A2S7END6_9XANT|nr:hypothetical protein [Xanthomonas populi]PPU92854.1 hypothetical protein XpopCFBP1817_11630 [Xanthomonas populi]